MKMRIYVANNGDDLWSGTLPAPNRHKSDGPFASITRAMEKVRKEKNKAANGHSSFTVYLREGLHILSSPLKFTTEDSGTKENPIIYRNYPEETPVISGGFTLPAWKKGCDGLWRIDLSRVMNTRARIDQIFIEGQRRLCSRVPNEGFFIAEGQLILDDGKPWFKYKNKRSPIFS